MQVVSLPTADERKKMEAAGRPLPDPSLQAYDEKVDVWAIGILAYELMVGRPPFEVEDEKETALRIMQARAPAGLPLCAQCGEKRAISTFPSGGEGAADAERGRCCVRSALHHMLGSARAQAARTPPRPHRKALWH